MRDLKDFIGPVETPAMSVQVIDMSGELVKVFDAPVGFQLERYVDSIYPGREFMSYDTDHEVNVSVVNENLDIVEIYRGVYK